MLGRTYDRVLCASSGTQQLLERPSSIKIQSSGGLWQQQGVHWDSGGSGLHVDCQEMTDVCPTLAGQVKPLIALTED